MPAYDYHAIERKWQERWKAEGTYKFDLNAPGEIYSIDNPPSFTSGSLHMGHALNHSWIDFIARYKRMRGYNVLFPLGYDCHGLPTELRVEKEYGISKDQRELFRQKCEEWTTMAIARMDEQYTRLGYSADWSQYYETRSPEYKKKVQYSLIEFYKMGRVFRQKHPVLWCPNCRTALAKAEVGYVEEQGSLWHLRFDVYEPNSTSGCVGGTKTGESVVIATTRPEFVFACVGVFVNPEDERNKHLVGKMARIPYANRDVEIRADKDVDMTFGTGIVYVCTFGDEMDIEWQKRYKLPIHRIVDENGRMTEMCGEYKGMTVKEARKRIAERMKADGVLVKTEPYPHNTLCHTDRASCMCPIELITKDQWFIKLKDKLKDVKDAARRMSWYPSNMLVRLEDWTDALDWDWIISRQRVYGTPIPFWHCAQCGEIVPPDAKQLPVDTMRDQPPVKKCPKCGSAELRGTEDVCDCWVDSSITPLAVAKWLEDDKQFKKCYPAGLRPQGYEIIRTWAFYTTFRCLLLTGKLPFRDLVINGMVAGPDGRKMSKSYNNIVAPEEALDKNGSDALRQWALMGSLGEDYPFSWNEITYGLKLQKKYWNASYFASMHLTDYDGTKPKKMRFVDEWLLAKLNYVIKYATEQLDRYEFAKALSAIREFYWHDFCDNYLEMIKDRIYNAKGDEKKAALYVLSEVLLKSSLLLAPFIPHVTEEAHELYLRGTTQSKSIHLMRWPKWEEFDEDYIEAGKQVCAIVSEIRKFKSTRQIPLNEELAKVEIFVDGDLSCVEEALKDIEETIKANELELKQGKGELPVEGYPSISLIITK